VFALRAWNIEISNIPELAPEQQIAMMRLQFWRDAINQALDGKAAKGHPILEALSQSTQTHKLQRGFFKRVLDARVSHHCALCAHVCTVADATKGT
jgi:hypothetical protein